MYTPPPVPKFRRAGPLAQRNEEAVDALLDIYRDLYELHQQDLDTLGRSTTAAELFRLEVEIAKLGVSLRGPVEG
jgi:hypothetical protein